MTDASAFLAWSFAALALAVATLFLAGLRIAYRDAGARPFAVGAIATAGWMAATLAAAAAGRLSFQTPPTMALVLAGTLAIALGVGLSPVGKRLATTLPLAALVGAQGFRLPLELLMHRAYAEGLMPVQMSYSGRNFDIVTGITALVVAAILLTGRRPRQLVLAWNVLGVVLLANIVIVALLSAPTALRVFHNEPANVWITTAPFVWLPSVFVLAAILGHILVARRLRLEARHG